MTLAPANLLAVASYWTKHGGVNLGIVGDTSHVAGGTSYHLGKDHLKPGAYSAITARDRAGLSVYASAFDMGKLGGTYTKLRTFSGWLVDQCRANASDTRDIREVIWSPDGQVVMRWDRERGVASQPRDGEADFSHRTHTHVSYYRDSRGRPQVGPFQRYFEPTHVPVVHIAKGATIRVYALSTSGCIKSWKDIDWPRDASQAAAYPGGEVKRRTCDGTSWAYTIRVKSALATINGRWIQTRANGVTYS